MRRSALLAVAVLPFAASCIVPAVGGSLTETGGAIAPKTFSPDACVSGELYELYGLVLGRAGWMQSGGDWSVDFEDGVIKLVLDPKDGWSLVLARRLDGPPEAVVRADQCRTLSVVAPESDWFLPDMLLSGHATIDCPLPGGGRIAGLVTFDDCSQYFQLDEDATADPPSLPSRGAPSESPTSE